MKVTMEIDCTPDEARQFFGLPDVKPLQAAVMAKMEAQMTEAANRFSPDGLLKSWLTLLPQAPDQLAGVLSRFFRPPTDTGPGKGGSS